MHFDTPGSARHACSRCRTPARASVPEGGGRPARPGRPAGRVRGASSCLRCLVPPSIGGMGLHGGLVLGRATEKQRQEQKRKTSSGEYRGVPGSIGKFRGMPGSSGEFRGVPRIRCFPRAPCRARARSPLAGPTPRVGAAAGARGKVISGEYKGVPRGMLGSSGEFRPVLRINS